MELEYAALMRNQTWELVLPSPSQTAVQCKWIFQIKYKLDGTLDRHNARLVAKGFQQTPGVDFFDTFSPVVQHIDVNNAFLNGDLHETVFMTQPEGFTDSSKPTHVCRLRKALYGLKQAPRAWFDHLKLTLYQKGFQNSVSDSSLFFHCKDGSLMFLLVDVDDLWITGDDPAAIQHLIHELNRSFALKTPRSVRYFLGFEVERTSTVLHLQQSKYAYDLLLRTNMAHAKTSPTPLCINNKLHLGDSQPFDHPSLYRSTIGALQYLTHSRPDISFSVSKLSQFLHAPTVAHWFAC